MITIDRIRDTEGFKALRPEWNELLLSSSVDCLFLTWEWMFTWWMYLSGDRALYIITVRRDARLIAVAPLVLRPRRLLHLLPFKGLEFLGNGNVGSDYLDILIRKGCEDDALRSIAGCLTESRMMLDLSQVERTSHHATGLALQLRQLGWRPARITINFCPYIRLSGHTWDSYLASLGRSHRYNFRRRLKNLDKRFNVSFERVRQERHRRESLETLVSLHMKRWRSRGGTDAFHTPELIRFHDELTRIALRRGWLRLYVLWLDSAPAAALYGFRYGNVFYFYQSGFDPAYGRYSVGLVTMGLAIKSATEEGAHEFDLLHGHEDYKFLWTRHERELTRLEMFPPHVRGLIYKHVMHLRWIMKRTIWRWVPQPIGEYLAPGRRLELWDLIRSKGRYAAWSD